MDYILFLRDRLSGCRICRHGLRLAAAVFLVVEFCAVSSALTERGADLCLSRTSPPGQPARATEKRCVAELLAADVAQRQRVALHLRGNCQGERSAAMMASRYGIAEVALEQTRPACSAVIGS